MKKIIISIYLYMIFTAVFAAPLKYDVLMAKAKESEEKHEWVYALGYYFDAAHLNSLAEEPRLRYKAIKKGFEAGKIGLDEVPANPFEKIDQWTKVKDEFQKYFTDYPTFDFYYYDLFDFKLNSSDKTGSCKTYIYVEESKKFIELSNILLKNLPEELDLYKAKFDYEKYSEKTLPKYNLYSEIYTMMEDSVINYYKKCGIAFSDNVWNKILTLKDNSSAGWCLQSSEGTTLSSVNNNYITLAFVDSNDNILQIIGESNSKISLKEDHNSSREIYLKSIELKKINSDVINKFYSGEKIQLKPVKVRLPVSLLDEPSYFHTVENVDFINCFKLKTTNAENIRGYFYLNNQLKENETIYLDNSIEIKNNIYSNVEKIAVNDDCFNETLYEYIPVKIELCADSKISDLKNCYELFLKALEEYGYRYVSDDELKIINNNIDNSKSYTGVSLNDILEPSEEFIQKFENYIDGLKKTQKKRRFGSVNNNIIPMVPVLYFIRK